MKTTMALTATARWSRTRRLGIAGAALTGALLAGGSIAAASATTNTPTYSACLSKSARTFYRVTISPARPASCKTTDRSVSWNQTGPQGPAGPAGATGPAGPAGPGAAAFTASGTYTVPHGVTGVLVELRGGGGGGNGDFLGGGQASELRALIPVSPGSQLTVTIGAGGNGASGDFSGGAGNGFASTVAVGGAVAAYAGGGGGGGVNGAAGEPGTAVVSAPATGLEDLPAAAGSPAGAGGGPPGYTGSGGAGAAPGDNSAGQNGTGGIVIIIPTT